MSEDTLTPEGLVNEATDMFRRFKETGGRRVERLVSEKKLQQIVDQETALEVDVPKGSGLDIFISGLLDDYEPVEDQRPGISDAVRNMAGTTKEAIKKDLEQTVEQYGDLTFSEDSDPTIVASNRAERSAILKLVNCLDIKLLKMKKGE